MIFLWLWIWRKNFKFEIKKIIIKYKFKKYIKLIKINLNKWKTF